MAKLGSVKTALQGALFHPEKAAAAPWAVQACEDSLLAVDRLLKDAVAVNKGGATTLPWTKDQLHEAANKADADALLLNGQCDAAQKAKIKRGA